MGILKAVVQGGWSLTYGFTLDLISKVRLNDRIRFLTYYVSRGLGSIHSFA